MQPGYRLSRLPTLANIWPQLCVTWLLLPPVAAHFNFVPGFIYALKSFRSGKYCRDHGNSISCDQEVIGETERFTFDDADNGLVSMKGGKNQKYCGDGVNFMGNFNCMIKCNQNAVGNHEKFKVEQVDGEPSMIGLKGGRCSKFCKDNAHSNTILCDAHALQNWEKFTPLLQAFYVLGARGDAACPAHFEKITDTLTCRVASATLLETYDASKNQGNNALVVCNGWNCDPGLGKCSGTRLSNDYGVTAKWLCKIKHCPHPVRLGELGRKECPAGYTPITDKDTCKEAAVYPGLAQTTGNWNGSYGTGVIHKIVCNAINCHHDSCDMSMLSDTYDSNSKWICWLVPPITTTTTTTATTITSTTPTNTSTMTTSTTHSTTTSSTTGSTSSTSVSSTLSITLTASTTSSTAMVSTSSTSSTITTSSVSSTSSIILTTAATITSTTTTNTSTMTTSTTHSTTTSSTTGSTSSTSFSSTLSITLTASTTSSTSSTTATKAMVTGMLTSVVSTSTTTTTGIHVAKAIGGALAQEVAEERTALIVALRSGNVTRVETAISGATLVAHKLTLADLQEAGINRTEVSMGDSSIKVSVPVAMLAQFGEDVVITIAAFDEPSKAQVTAVDGHVVEVHGLLSVEVSQLTDPGSARQVSGLSEPILLTLGIAAGKFSCAYFDEQSQGWSSSGVQTVTDKTGGPLTCATTHLSLFGGIIQGFTAAFECSTATLMTAEGVSKIGHTKWFMELPGLLLLSFILVTVAFLLAAHFFDVRHHSQRLVNDQVFLIIEMRRSTRQVTANAGATETRTEQSCGCSYWSDAWLLLQHVGTEALASMGDLCYFIKEMKNNLQGCFSSYGGGFSRRDAYEAVMNFMTNMKVDAIYGVSASKLHIQVDDVHFFVAKARVEQETCGGDTPRSLILDNMTSEVVEQVQDDYRKILKCSQLPMFFFWMFASRCTLIAILRSSLFIPASMTAMLFAVDMHAAAALGALFFQASGGALAENADERCEPKGIEQRLGRLIAIGVVTVLVGMLPSMILARLHHRDFIKIDSDELDEVTSTLEWKNTLRLWQIQDRLIYLMCTVLLAFCMFFNVVFIANVTVEDGNAWFVCVVTSMAQTILGVPFLMTVMTFMVTVLIRPVARVRRASSHLCLCEGVVDNCDDNADNLEPKASMKSSVSRMPVSKWHSNKLRRSIRKNASYHGMANANREDPVDDFNRSTTADLDWDNLSIDDVATEATDKKAQCCNPMVDSKSVITCSNFRANVVCCSLSISSSAARAGDGTGGLGNCGHLAAV